MTALTIDERERLAWARGDTKEALLLAALSDTESVGEDVSEELWQLRLQDSSKCGESDSPRSRATPS